ncbi:inositol monophosphatase family protein [Halovivax gelatinilyticus]|uniref:inositol monophosphatase family protein n=1 Tax=Halovivax gelatinilyticus TaxID=2961597 RepID=UPI0020CA73BE|nr:inositol monophosphatase [Halovivax gelatinilyticus]
MDDSTPDTLETHALEAAKDGASVAENAFRTEFDVETKASKTDLVTRIDRDAQRAVVERIRTVAPEDVIVGEEGDLPKEVPASGRAWIVDPIDGTANFVRGVPTFATAVAVVSDGDPLAAAVVFPILGDAYVVGDDPRLNGTPLSVSDRDDPHICTVSPGLWWDRDRRDEYARACAEIVHRFGDLRRVGCAQAELSMVASGALDATIANVSAPPWDTVAGAALVSAAGGTVTDLDGEPWDHTSAGLVASNGSIHEEALAAARAIES